MHAHNKANLNRMAASATLHCLTGCAIGEISGLVVGTILGFSAFATIMLAVALAFVFGFTLSTLPLLRAGLRFGAALSLGAGVLISAASAKVATEAYRTGWDAIFGAPRTPGGSLPS